MVEYWLSFFVIANLAQQGVAISMYRLPQSLALLRNDDVLKGGIPAKAGIQVRSSIGEGKRVSAAAHLHQFQTMLLAVEQVVCQDIQCLDERFRPRANCGAVGFLLLADAAFFILDQKVQTR